ncbi:hypothetical protein H920_06708 [Fukomys damarensis]|uniref:Uncharacterized protein n=1 Tax=Fukomys damarensis TaxID=885580 RepID=A0A091DLI2_FUKDA|nr:hypothetical protein H920_06708 [Fukomys damarensis]
MPIPDETKTYAVPPFILAENDRIWKHTIYIYVLLGKNFCVAYFSGYMNYMYYQIVMLLGVFQLFPVCGAMGYFISIHLLPGKEYAIAFYKGMTAYVYYEMMELLGRTLKENPDVLRTFEEYVEWKGRNKSEIIDPPDTEMCKERELQRLPRKEDLWTMPPSSTCKQISAYKSPTPTPAEASVINKAG